MHSSEASRERPRQAAISEHPDHRVACADGVGTGGGGGSAAAAIRRIGFEARFDWLPQDAGFEATVDRPALASRRRGATALADS